MLSDLDVGWTTKWKCSEQQSFCPSAFPWLLGLISHLEWVNFQINAVHYWHMQNNIWILSIWNGSGAIFWNSAFLRFVTWLIGKIHVEMLRVFPSKNLTCNPVTKMRTSLTQFRCNHVEIATEYSLRFAIPIKQPLITSMIQVFLLRVYIYTCART